ncbi:MAG: RIP metalloprotease RseP [Bacilli bacterium]|nr:RIP metalloprotease RseP [Bacilli bacterium]
MTIIYFILILGITVFIHELGHFLFAKKFGVHVYEFSIGMGPRIFKFNRKNDETDYCIRLFPIGGFVQMAGEEAEVDESIPKDKNLQTKPAWQRALIMGAGVMMNFLLAIVLLFFIGLFNEVSLNNVYVANSTISGLSDNDKIVAIDGSFVNNYDKLSLELTIVDGDDFTMTVKDANGNKKDVSVNPIAVGKSYLLYEMDYGFEVSDLTVTKSSLSEISENDKITAINGIQIENYSELLTELEKVDDSSFLLTVQSQDGTLKESTIQPKELDDDELLGYNYGFYITGTTEKGFFAAIKYAFIKFFSTIEQMVFTVFYLITGKISLTMLSGPVGIFNAVSVYSQYGFANLVSLLCLICINVGFINLLPIPAFDGCHLLFIIIEKIKGSRVNPKITNIISTVGFILLMILMLVVTFNDILRLF